MDSTGEPSAGFSRLLRADIKSRASACASADRGRWTAIWSPSKSALKPEVTSGLTWIAWPSISFGWKAWIDKRCKVGARFSRTYLPWITSSKASQTTGSPESIRRWALWMLWACSHSISFEITNGLNNSRAIVFGRPHWSIDSSGPDTMTERPE